MPLVPPFWAQPGVPISTLPPPLLSPILATPVLCSPPSASGLISVSFALYCSLTGIIKIRINREVSISPSPPPPVCLTSRGSDSQVLGLSLSLSLSLSQSSFPTTPSTSCSAQLPGQGPPRAEHWYCPVVSSSSHPPAGENGDGGTPWCCSVLAPTFCLTFTPHSCILFSYFFFRMGEGWSGENCPEPCLCYWGSGSLKSYTWLCLHPSKTNPLCSIPFVISLLEPQFQLLYPHCSPDLKFLFLRPEQ